MVHIAFLLRRDVRVIVIQQHNNELGAILPRNLVKSLRRYFVSR